MKVVLFCGGLGTRLREYSDTIPKPLVTIGQRPIIWHLMRYYAHHGHTDFVLCLGYRGDLIKEYFLNYSECLSNDFVLKNGGKDIKLFNEDISQWKITFIDTGTNSNIGQRLLRVKEHLMDEEMFMANYADGLSNLPLQEYIDEFERKNAIASFVSVRPSQSFHAVSLDQEHYVTKIERVESAEFWINGGFMILKKDIFNYINEGEELVEEPFQRLIPDKKLISYRYTGFWSAMDTFKDKKKFDSMYDNGDTPWEVWR